MTTLSGFYQLPDDAAPAGRTQVEADLLNFLDGQLLYASGTDVPVTAPVNEDRCVFGHRVPRGDYEHR
jgi:hypothetical protein